MYFMKSLQTNINSEKRLFTLEMLCYLNNYKPFSWKMMLDDHLAWPLITIASLL